MTISTLTFLFDYSSPFAYLGAEQVEEVARAHGADLRWHPFLLGALFKAIGTPMVPLLEMPAIKQQYQQRDIQRWAAHLGVPLAWPSRFPMNTVSALRMTLQVEGEARAAFAKALFRAYWADDRDLHDPAVLVALAGEQGLDGAALLAGCERPEVKAMLRETTSKAEAVGCCGAPSFLVSTEGKPDMLFWGQDRLVLVGRALDGWRPACG